MLIIEDIEVKWTPSNKKHYESLGYKYVYRGSLIVKTNELPSGCHKKVNIKCEYCGDVFKRNYKDYVSRKQNHIIDKDACSKCYQLKVKETREKQIKGNPNYYKEIWEKTKNTINEKYNVENVMHIEETKEKIKQTNIEKYGVPYYMMTDEWTDKVRETFLEKYGEINPMKTEKIQEKVRKSLYENGTAPSSKQQRYLNELLDGELNYPIRNFSLDIAFPEEEIYIEYNGSGHWLSIKTGTYTEEQYKHNERKRWYYLYNNGWKEIRIKSLNDLLPSDEVIIHMINDAKDILNNGRSWVEFDIDNRLINTSQYSKLYNFGNLRKITKSDISPN